MTDRMPTGARIRERRQDRGLRQAELASRVGISPSYLNLIEHGRRRIAGRLLADLARALDTDAAALADAPDASRVQALRAAAEAVDHARPLPELARAQDLLDRFPGWAALVVAQGRRIGALETRVAELSGRLVHDHDLAQALHQVLSAATAIRSTAGILSEDPDLDRDWRSRFLNNIRAESESLAQSSRALTGYLEAPERSVPLGPSAQDEADRWLDARDHHLPEIEAGAPLLDPPDGAAGSIIADWAARYAADAAALPLAEFVSAARDGGYDPAALARRFDVPIDRAMRRLASLPPGQGHPPIGLAICDASGTLTHLKAIEGVALPRSGGCPLWPLYDSLAQPGRPLRAVAAMPGQGARRILCHAVAAHRAADGWNAPPRIEATMILAPMPPAPDPGDRPVGPACRICPRIDCPSRREPSILR